MGQINNGKIIGKGFFVLPDCSILEGEFLKNKFLKGIVHFSNGAKFEGKIIHKTLYFEKGNLRFKNGIQFPNK